VLGITPASLFSSAFTITMNRIVCSIFSIQRAGRMVSICRTGALKTRRTGFCRTDMSDGIISKVIAPPAHTVPSS
jgi:signal transduction protein with GAF and PtsI domain